MSIMYIDWGIIIGVPGHGDNHSEDTIPTPYQPNNCDGYPVCAPVGISMPTLITPFAFASVTTMATANVATILPNSSATVAATSTSASTATMIGTPTVVPSATSFPTSSRISTATLRPTYTPRQTPTPFGG